MEENIDSINQPVFSEPEYISKSIKLKLFHQNILDAIDTNTSNAIRLVIEDYYRHNQSLNRDKLIIDLCLGMLLLGIGLIAPFWFASLAFYGVGTGCIIYGIVYFIENKRNRI